MTDKIWYQGKWFFNISMDSWCYRKPGAYVPGEMATVDDYSHSIQAREIETLIRALDEEGWIKPRLDERLRTEDLKITHRLIDLLENATKK